MSQQNETLPSKARNIAFKNCSSPIRQCQNHRKRSRFDHMVSRWTWSHPEASTFL